MWVIERAVRHCSRISEPMKPVAPARTILGILVWLCLVVWRCCGLREGGFVLLEESGLEMEMEGVAGLKVEDVGKEKQKERVLYSSGFWTACD
jgi:hypothetical protein